MLIDRKEGRQYLSVCGHSHGSVFPSSAKNSHYQSKVFVCVSANGVDVVNWLLIICGITNFYAFGNNGIMLFVFL